MRSVSGFLILTGLLGFAAVAHGGTACPDLAESTATTNAGTAMLTPGGTGPSLAQRSATIEIVLLDPTGSPVVGYPRQDVWLDGTAAGSVQFCAQGTIADADTDASGHTTMARRLSGGGYASQSCIFVCGTQLLGPPLPIALNSPDLNGDLVVDIVDFGIFGSDFGSGAFRSDLEPDGVIDLTDFAHFGTRFGETCP